MFIVSVLLYSLICNENSVLLCSLKLVFQFKIYTHKRSKVMRQDHEEATPPIFAVHVGAQCDQIKFF